MKTLMICAILAANLGVEASAGTYCSKIHDVNVVKSAYVPILLQMQEEIKRIQETGLDPAKYLVDLDGMLVPISYKYGVVFQRYSAEASHVSGQEAGCMKATAPVQLAADIGVILSTAGLSLVLPNRITHVDMAAVMNGKPFGSDSAFIPKARDDLFRFIGVDPKHPGTIGNIIKDPWRCISFKRKC